MVCVICVKTSPAAKKPSPCVKSMVLLVDHDRVPMTIKNYTCHNRVECYPALASTMVVNITNSKTETLNIVADCLEKIACPAGKIKKVKINMNHDTKPFTPTFVGCYKKEDEIFIMQPIIKHNGELEYKKVVYDCRCSCM